MKASLQSRLRDPLRRQRRLPIAGLVVLVAVAALTLAACGGGSYVVEQIAPNA